MHAGGAGRGGGGGDLSLNHISSDQVLDLRKEIAETEAVAAGNNKQVAAHSHLSCFSLSLSLSPIHTHTTHTHAHTHTHTHAHTHM
jgi:hypothetical protein